MPLHSAGTILEGRYRIDGVIGQGGMGAVYHAEDVFKGEEVAVKELLDEAITDPAEKDEARRLFDNEARILSQLAHPALVGVRDRFSDGRSAYLVMDYVKGETLESLLERGGRFPEGQVADWAAQLAEALKYLHYQAPPVIFRDLKPSNVIVTPSGQLKLIDFGIARTFKRGKSEDTVNIGSPGYAAPEQYGGRGQTDPRTDIYALGVLLHQLLTGIDPSLHHFSLPPVTDSCPDASPRIVSIIENATRLAPEERYQRIEELQRDLRAGPSLPPAAPLPPPALSLSVPSLAVTAPSPSVRIEKRLFFAAVGFIGPFLAVMLPFLAGAASENPYQAAQLMAVGFTAALATGAVISVIAFSSAQ